MLVVAAGGCRVGEQTTALALKEQASARVDRVLEGRCGLVTVLHAVPVVGESAVDGIAQQHQQPSVGQLGRQAASHPGDGTCSTDSPPRRGGRDHAHSLLFGGEVRTVPTGPALVVQVEVVRALQVLLRLREQREDSGMVLERSEERGRATPLRPDHDEVRQRSPPARGRAPRAHPGARKGSRREDVHAHQLSPRRPG